MMADEAEINLTVNTKAKLLIEKIRDPRPSIWLSVFKWLFAIFLSLLVLACVVSSKISLISIGIFYNNTRSQCSKEYVGDYSKETTFIMMVLVLMIPQFLSFARACWGSMFSKSHPWPSTSAIVSTLIAVVLEVAGLCYFVIVIVLKTPLPAAHCVLLMNSVFLVPIGAQIFKIGKHINENCKLFIALLSAFIFELIGIGLLTYHVILKEYMSLKENIGVAVSLLCVSIAWCNKIQRLQMKRRKNDNDRDGFTGSMPSVAGIADFSLNDDEVEDSLKETARGKSTIISGIVKLVITPFVAALFCYVFNVADLNNLRGGFKRMTVNHPAMPHFIAQILTSFIGSILGWLACAMCMQRPAFFFPMIFATPLSLLLIYIKKFCCSPAIPFKCGEDYSLILVVAGCLCLAQGLSTVVYLWKEQTFIMAKESKLFWLPVYNGAFLEQNLLLNRKNKITDESQVNQREVAKKSCVYICTTMYHETENEMEQLLHSLHDVDTARQGSKRQFESHIFFDGAVKGDVLNDFVLQLISLVPKTLKVKIENCMKLKTPYGLQLRWKLPGGMPFHIHLKDNLKVKNKKRWSQAMYMSYVLDYKQDSMEITDEHTYILATDADVKFTHESVQALLDLMMRDEQVGAVCGRTHPLGSGPVVWYQVFDYAIGHWFQKVANHVLGSVLCSPGCFSVYRAQAIREVLPIYASRVNTSIDFLTKDMGEDRWLCTLMVQTGWRLEYCAASEDSTYCPDSFEEFFQQRRRWIPSTLVNLIQLISEWKTTVENNDKISVFFIFYQALLVISTLLSPATVILVVTGALKYSKMPGMDNDILILVLLCLITFGFAFICLYTKQPFQLKVAKFLTVFFSLLMAFVVVGMAAQMGIDLSKRSKCGEITGHSSIPSGNYSVPTTLIPTTLPIECTDHLPADISTLYFTGLVGIFLLAALMHPTEAYCLVHGVWYLCCLPSGYLLLIIYSLANITDRSWGTRETKEKNVGDDMPWYHVMWEKLRYVCLCCRPEDKTAQESEQKTKDSQPQEEILSDSIFSDDDPSSEDNRTNSESADSQTSPSDSPTPSVQIIPLPDPPKSALKSKLRRAHSAEEHLSEEKPKWRFPGEKKTVRFDTKMPKLYGELPVEEWLSDLRPLYAKNFLDNGYDNVSFIIGMTDKDLRSIGISKRGHRMQLKHLIERIPHIPLNTDVPDNVEEWLHELGLEHYWTYFQNSGYTEPRILEDLKAMDQETLRKTLKEDLNICKVAHVNKMIKAVKNLQYPTPAQREIRRTRDLIGKVHISDIQHDNQDDGKEYHFWKKLRNACLLPESAIFGAVTELKEKLEDLRDSFLSVFAIANVMWIIIIVTLDKQTELKVLGETNAIGFAFLVTYGVLIVIMFLTLIWHRLSTICHLMARAPWKRGPFQLSWAFKDENLPPEPTPEELDQIRQKKNKRSRRKTGRRRNFSGSLYQPIMNDDEPCDYGSSGATPHIV